MAQSNGELLKRLLATFRVEADEHLQALSSGLHALEKAPAGKPRAQIIESVFRETHSLKGAARAVNLRPVASVCQPLESVLAALKAGRIESSPSLIDLLHRSVDALGALVRAEPRVSSLPPATASLIRKLESAVLEQMPPRKASAAPETADENPVPPVQPPTLGLAETVRVSTTRLDAVMRQVEELLSPRLAAGQRARELQEAAATLESWKKQRLRLQPALRRVEREALRKPGASSRNGRELSRLLEYLEAERLHMKTLEDRLAKLERSTAGDQRTLSGMTDALHRHVKEMQLLPFTWLLENFPRFVRDLAREQGKDVELVIQGGEIEIDRRILEEMKAPLIHLLRNSLDHGIETPAARAQARKPPRGTITLTVSQKDSGKVELRIADDGAGIDVDKVKTVARKLGLLSEQDLERLGDAEALALVFRSGISTSPIITDVSGRGLGLAIVREKVDRLGGVIRLESRRGEGAAFLIVLPLALAMLRGVLVRAGEQLCVIPASSVQRVIRVAGTDIQTVENREAIALDGQAVALAWLTDVLELPRPPAAAESGRHAPAVVLGSDLGRMAFRVEELIREQDVLVKSLGPQLVRVRNVAGVCVLGTGQTVPVLNVPDLLKSASRRAAVPLAPAAAASPPPAPVRSILVVEDSITSRSLLKNILESAGYRVGTAVDGAEAYATLKTGDFDLVVSDIEMPRMDGFELTARVRADQRLSELPVVLVTALSSREHRERGIDVGANAYIVKSSFDQSNLLDVIQRLIGPGALRPP